MSCRKHFFFFKRIIFSKMLALCGTHQTITEKFGLEGPLNTMWFQASKPEQGNLPLELIHFSVEKSTKVCISKLKILEVLIVFSSFTGGFRKKPDTMYRFGKEK